MNFLNDTFIHAISWTLIHSLWIGLILALLGGIIVMATQKAAAAVRYNLLAALSVAFLVTIGFVFAGELERSQASAASCAAAPVAVTGITPGIAAEAAAPVCAPAPEVQATAPVKADETPLSMLSSFINNYAQWIAWIWFIVFSFRCFRMIDGVRHVYRVRNYQVLPPSESWQQRMEELRSLLKVSSRVKLLESRLVSVPSVTGFFKPIILVPVGLLSNLPQEQVEAILLHELAHIRRSDYLVNFVQSLMEIIFFFNPGVLWISSLLKDERENCCDDLAISVTNDKREFVHALVSFQEYNLAGQQLAMQFGHKKMHLADRAGRILFNRNKMLSKAEKYFLSLCIVAGAGLCLSLTNTSDPEVKENKKRFIALPPDTLVSDTLYRSRRYDPKAILEGTSLKYMDVVDGKEYYTYVFKHKGVMYQVSEDMKSIYVNGKYVSGSDRKKYEGTVGMLIDEYEAAIASADAESLDNLDELEALDSEAAALDAEAANRELEAQSRELEKQSLKMERLNKQVERHSLEIERYSKQMMNKDQREIERLQKEIDKEHKELTKVTDELQREAIKLDAHARKVSALAEAEALRSMKQSQREMIAETRRMETEIKRIETESKRVESESRRVEAESRRVEAQSRKVEAQSRKVEANSKKIAEMEVIDNIIRDVKKAGFAQEIKSLKLDEKELIINGRKQSAEMHARLKKYTSPGTTHMFNMDYRTN